MGKEKRVGVALEHESGILEFIIWGKLVKFYGCPESSQINLNIYNNETI